jgi:hypothetical protein
MLPNPAMETNATILNAHMKEGIDIQAPLCTSTAMAMSLVEQKANIPKISKIGVPPTRSESIAITRAAFGDSRSDELLCNLNFMNS